MPSASSIARRAICYHTVALSPTDFPPRFPARSPGGLHSLPSPLKFPSPFGEGLGVRLGLGVRPFCLSVPDATSTGWKRAILSQYRPCALQGLSERRTTVRWQTSEKRIFVTAKRRKGRPSASKSHNNLKENLSKRSLTRIATRFVVRPTRNAVIIHSFSHFAL